MLIARLAALLDCATALSITPFSRSGTARSPHLRGRERTDAHAYDALIELQVPRGR